MLQLEDSYIVYNQEIQNIRAYISYIGDQLRLVYIYIVRQTFHNRIWKTKNQYR